MDEEAQEFTMINRRQFTKYATISALGTLALAKTSKGTSLPPTLPPDKLQIRAATELDSFVAWLAKNNAKGFIGELGFPGDRKKIDENNCGRTPPDFKDDFRKWNALAESWYVKADAARLWATIWATGDWWTDYRPGHEQDYSLAVYKTTKENPETVSIPNTQATVVENHLSTAAYERGITVAGAEFGVRDSETSKTLPNFSNKKPGKYGEDYQYPSHETFAYLASRGIGLVRIPFRWERIQRQLKGSLNREELNRLKAAVTSARQSSPDQPNGMKVILDVHNFGAYYDAPRNDGIGKRHDFTEPGFEQYLIDLWTRLSKEFKSTPNVYYGLMCEPIDAETDNANGPPTAHTKAWELASQKVLEKLRRLGDDKLVIVSGYLWSSVRKWGVQHPAGWIRDPKNNFMYEAHHYWDDNYSGHYCRSYDDELALIRE